MNMKMNMEPIWSILKMIGYFLMELLVWIGTVLLHVTTFLLLFFVLRKVKNLIIRLCTCYIRNY